LLKLAASRQGGPLEADEAASLRGALDYFRDAAPKHTADEEDSLFPRMRAAGALSGLDGLEADHQVAGAAHREVDALGRKWLELSELSGMEAQRMTELLGKLAETYSNHIAMEDNEIFPAAARALNSEQLAEVGEEMKARRIRTETER